jgi:CheY-like chemotaxis protein
MARFTLERCGYSVELAPNGEAGVAAVAADPSDFAAVLLDLTMPVMSGEQALQRIRQIREDIPVVLSSGFSEVEALKRFHDRGLAGFLQKPYTATALARKIKQAVRGARPAVK